MIYSIITALVVGITAGYLGSLMVLKKMSLVGDALSHVALPGLALGILYKFDPFFGAFAFLFLSAFLTWWLERKTRLSFEALVGTLFTLALALGILMVPEPDLLEALFGDISKVSLEDMLLSIVVSIVALTLSRRIYNDMILGIISEDLATSAGIDVSRINLIYILMVSLVVAIGIKIVGTLLVGALVIVPAATSKNVSSSLKKYKMYSSFFGGISSALGVYLSNFLNIQAGPLVIIIGTLIFLLAIIIKSINAP